MPPIDRPIDERPWSQRSLQLARTRASTSAYQSCQRVRFISCQVVPWPGSRGSADGVAGGGEVLGPRRAWTAGMPVKPWQSSTPIGAAVVA